MKKRILFWSLILILVIGGSIGQTVFAGVTACGEAVLCHNFTDCTSCKGTCGGSITYTKLYGTGDAYHSSDCYEGVCNKCGSIRTAWYYYTKGQGSAGDEEKDERVYKCDATLTPGYTICGGSYTNYTKTQYRAGYCTNPAHGGGHEVYGYNWTVTCSKCGHVKTGSYVESCSSTLWSEPKYTTWKCTEPKPCPDCIEGKVYTTCAEHGRADRHFSCSVHNWIGTATYCSGQTKTCTLPVKCTNTTTIEIKCGNCNGTGKTQCDGTISAKVTSSGGGGNRCPSCGSSYGGCSYDTGCSKCGKLGSGSWAICSCGWSQGTNPSTIKGTHNATVNCTTCSGSGKESACSIHKTSATHYVCSTHNWWGTTTTHKYCEHGKISEHYVHYIFEPSASDMITEWNIPTANTEITLPVRYGRFGPSLSVTIDWGDGSVEECTSEFPTHKYTTAGTYDILVSGGCQVFGYAGSSSVNTTSSFYTMTQYMVGVKQLGEISALQYGFSNCKNLTYVSGENLVAPNTFNNVTEMQYMFNNCEKLIDIQASKFDTSKVTNMYEIFNGCKKIQTLDVSNWNTENVIYLPAAFHNCSGLTTLDLANWNTSKVTNMGGMFWECSGLRSIQVSNKFVMSGVTDSLNYELMFANTPNLTAIITVSETPIADQFAKVKDQLAGKTIYVPNKTAETAYESAWSADFTADRIEPILELVGSASVEINQGETYTDAGYTVAGFSTSDSAYYTPYGYSVAKSGTVNTAVPGVYNLTYTITRKTNNVMDAVRTVTVIRTTVDTSTLTVTLPSTTYEYTGSAITPEPTVKDGATTLTKGTDYTVEYSNNINAGTGTVKVTGINSYDGTKTVYFTITKKKIPVPTQSGSLTYNGSSQTPTWNNYDTKWMEIGGTTSGVNAGNYDADFTLKDPNNTEWAD